MNKNFNPFGVVPVYGMVLALGLSACNGGDQKLTLAPSSDNAPVTTVTPTPTPTVTTTPTPSPSPTPTTTPTDQVYTGPADLAKYVQKFIDDAKAQGVDVLSDMKNPKLEIRIAKLDSYGASVIGLCETAGTMRRVTFDPDFWNAVSETQRELLAHHELGHCVLYRGHRTATLSTGAYASIMYPIIMSSSTYNNNQAYYLEELFTYGAMSAQASSAESIHICNLEELY